MEVLFEFIAQGAYVKVIAVDADSGEEVSIIGDASRQQSYLEDIALKKLLYVMEKKKKLPVAKTAYKRQLPKSGTDIIV